MAGPLGKLSSFTAILSIKQETLLDSNKYYKKRLEIGDATNPVVT